MRAQRDWPMHPSIAVAITAMKNRWEREEERRGSPGTPWYECFSDKERRARYRYLGTLEAAGRMGFEAVMYDQLEPGEWGFRPVTKHEQYRPRIRCPLCGTVYEARSGEAMQRHMEKKHGDEEAFHKRFGIVPE